MSIQSDNIRAAVILDRVKGCKIEDNDGNQYSIVDVKVFNGLVSSIGLKDIPTGFIKYASFDAYMEMASVAWFFPLSNTNPFFLINMQVTSSVTVVDYYPEAFVVQDDSTSKVKRFIKRVYFRANGQRSYSVVSATDARYDWESRIANGATVTDFNIYRMNRYEYMPLMCW